MKEYLKSNILRIGDTIVDLTGEIYLLTNHHGVAVEVVGNYTNSAKIKSTIGKGSVIEKDLLHNKMYDNESIPFDNYRILSLGTLLAVDNEHDNIYFMEKVK